MASESVGLPENLEMALHQLVQALDRHHISYALIGGVAASFRSRPRFTRDLDFLLQVPQVALPGLLEELSRLGFSFDNETVIREWTQEHMTVLRYGRARIDWLKPVIPLYQHIIDTAKAESFLGCSVRIASAESLILTKILAFRDRDLVDIQNLLAGNRGKLDLDFIRREWLNMANADDPRMQRFEAQVEEFYNTSSAD